MYVICLFVFVIYVLCECVCMRICAVIVSVIGNSDIVWVTHKLRVLINKL